jgi:pSer/pThr/pTyr-binding forkhead associated (FHA) protein
MQLVVQSGAEPGRVYDLLEGSLSVGRQSVNEVVVNDEQVSRKHARIDVTPQGIVLTDNNSANGTFVNGTRISTPYVLKVGDTIQFGTTILKMVDNQTNSATMPTGMEQPAPSNYGGVAPLPPTSQLQPNSGGYNPTPSSAQPSPSYGGNYNQPQTGYAQPQPGGYAPQDYGQPNYGQSQTPAMQTTPAAKKGGFNPLYLILGGVVVVIAVVAILLVFLLGGGGGVGELPAPPNGTKVELSANELKNLPGVGSSLDKVKFSAFKSTDNSSSVYSFYKTEMGKKGWTVLEENPTAMALAKGDQAAGIVAFTLPDTTSLNQIIQAFPSLKDKIKTGETLVLLFTGSKQDLQIGN